jgi:polyferredoxin
VLAVVALQAAVGALCFLTLWQSALLRAAGGSADERSLIETIVTRLIFWPLPLWAFVVIYLAAFAYTLAMWWLVPPYRRPG